MKTSRFLFAAVALLSVISISSCSRFEEKSIESTHKVRFVASFGGQTKTSNQDNGVIDWTKGDIIRYYSAKGGTVKSFEVTQSGHHVVFEAEVADGAKYIIAAYGASGITNPADDSFTLTGAVKPIQTGDFASAHISAAISTDLKDGAALSFKNLTSIVKFTLQRSDIAAVTFTATNSEKLQGNGNLNLTVKNGSFTAAFPSNYGNSTIRINNGGAGTFYFATLPVTMANGFKLAYYDAEGVKIGQSNYTSELTIAANTILDIGTLDSKIQPVTIAVPEIVDMGLSVGWSSFNLGASVNYGWGDYFAWGEPATKLDFTWENYKWSNDDGTYFTKYVDNPTAGTVDNLHTVSPEDDPSAVILGQGWRTPTEEEWIELVDNCTWEWTTVEGSKGYKVTSKIPGYTDKSIFLPICGHRQNSGRNFATTDGYYWTSDISAVAPNKARYFQIADGKINRTDYERYTGMSIRPVHIYPSADFVPYDNGGTW